MTDQLIDANGANDVEVALTAADLRSGSAADDVERCRVTIALEAALYTRLKQFARQESARLDEDVSMTTVMVKALRGYLPEAGPAQPQGPAQDAAQDALQGVPERE